MPAFGSGRLAESASERSLSRRRTTVATLAAFDREAGVQHLAEPATAARLRVNVKLWIRLAGIETQRPLDS
jgi:hypothetical protein